MQAQLLAGQVLQAAHGAHTSQAWALRQFALPRPPLRAAARMAAPLSGRLADAAVARGSRRQKCLRTGNCKAACVSVLQCALHRHMFSEAYKRVVVTGQHMISSLAGQMLDFPGRQGVIRHRAVARLQWTANFGQLVSLGDGMKCAEGTDMCL